MASLALVARNLADLECRIEAFESAWKTTGSASLSDYLPAFDSPSFLGTLCELIRVDMELRWSIGEPRSLKSYLAGFPQLRDQQELLGQLAFEEFRQRVQAGHSVGVSDYAAAFGLDVRKWPKMASKRIARQQKNDETPPTVTISHQDLGDQRRGAGTAATVVFPSVGDDWNGFKLIGELGRGSFGRVFLAQQGELSDRLVALKFSTDLRGEPGKMARLQHTNIMPIHSTHRYGDLQAVCMPYFGSTTLAQVLKGMRAKFPSSGRMLVSTLFGRSQTVGSRASVSDSTPLLRNLASESEAAQSESAASPARSLADLERLANMSHVGATLWIIAHVADGLAHAHERGLLHRDLKPANILLTDDGQPMLLDFNLAANLGPEVETDRIRNGGTFPYMAPEQLEAALNQQAIADARSDLYSLGIILFEFLTGRPPFEQPSGATSEIVSQMLVARRGELPDARILNPNVSPAVAAIVRKLLAPDPVRRYQSARQLVEDLQRHQENLPLKFAPDASPSERFGKFRKRNPRLVTAAAVALAAIVLLVVPVSVIAVRQNDIARRASDWRRAEALNLMRETTAKMNSARIDLWLKNETHGLRKHGLSSAREVAAIYGADSDVKWLYHSRISALPDSQRHELLTNLGDTFLAAASALKQEADDKRDDEARGAALHWNRLSESCFARLGALPDRVRRQRDSLEGRPAAPGALEQPAALESLDEADLLALASDSFSSGGYRQARAALKVLTNRNPGQVMAWYLTGMNEHALGDIQAGINAYTLSIALHPECSWAHLNRGWLLLEMDQTHEAIADFDQVINLGDQNMAWALVDRGIAKRRLKDYSGAESDFTAAIEREDAPMRAWYLRAGVRRQLGKVEEAERDTKVAESLIASSEMDWTTRGFFRAKSDPEGAIKDFDRALKLNPRYFKALQNKAATMACQLNRQSDALAVLNQLVDYFPDRVQAHADRGVLLARLGRIDEACKEANFSLGLDRSAIRTYQIGSLYAALCKHDPKFKAEALRHLSESLRLGLKQREYFKTDADLDPIRDDPDFRKLAEIAATL